MAIASLRQSAICPRVHVLDDRTLAKSSSQLQLDTVVVAGKFWVVSPFFFVSPFFCSSS